MIVKNKGARRRTLCSFFLLCAFFLAPSVHADVAERARDLKIWQKPQWLLLGHWQKKLFGYKSEVDGPNFFLAASGRNDPEAELTATLKAFAESKGAGSAQCRFLARRAWLFAELKITEIPRDPCTEITEWKRKLDADGFSFVFASSFMNNAASMFGHTFLKIHTRSNSADRDLLNYGVSFLARTSNAGEETFAPFGLIGLYPGFFTMEPFHETLRQYTNLDGRDVWEYKLNLTPAEVERLLDHLIELQQTSFSYYFFDKNCSYQLVAALEVAKPDVHIRDKFFYESIPADVIRLLTRIPGLVGAINYRPSLATLFRASLDPLSRDEKALVKPLVSDASPPLLDYLEASRKALVLDSAIAYSDLVATDKDRAYQLKMARATTGITKAERDLSQDASRPEQGHDPALVGLGAGNRGANPYEEAKFRLAYQELLEDDTGYQPNTELEVGRFSFRRYGQSPNFVVNEATLVDVMSLASTDRFFQPLSWRLHAGFMRLPDRPETDAGAESVNAGVGYTFDLFTPKFIWFSFLQMHADAGQDLPTGYRVGSSAETQVLFRPARWMRFNAGFAERGYYLGATSLFPATWLRASLSISRNFEVDAKTSLVNSISETSAMLSYHFVL